MREACDQFDCDQFEVFSVLMAPGCGLTRPADLAILTRPARHEFRSVGQARYPEGHGNLRAVHGPDPGLNRAGPGRTGNQKIYSIN